MDTIAPTGALSAAKSATDWLQYAGGWAMFVIACVVIYFLVKHILSLNAKLDARADECRKELTAKEVAHKEEITRVMREHQERLEEKDEKLFGLLDKTNELLAAVQQLRSQGQR